MLLSCAGEVIDAPAVLQLKKWSTSQLDLSEFREACISPTRELLILLSYQYEALLLPLITGELQSRHDLSGGNSGCYQGLGSSALLASSRSDSLDNIPCTSESVEAVSDSVISLESASSRSKDYPAVFDVKSLAWGHCGDAYDQHKDAKYKEFLFISGDHGITVHAFCYLDRNNQNNKHSPMVGQGKWVEWGPTTIHRTQENEQSSYHGRDTGDVWNVNSTTIAEASPHDFNEAENNESCSGDFTAKKWLRTFFTEVKTIESEGKILTRFPENSSFPCFTEIVSFSILDSVSKIFDFLYPSYLASDIKDNCSLPEVLKESVPGHSSGSSLNQVPSSDAISKVLRSGTSSSFKCSRVFSSSSHRLIGLVLTMEDPILVNNNEDNAISKKIFVMVAVIYQWGIEWVSCVKLQDMHLNPGPEIEWADFQFSNGHLVCLSASGLVCIYGATTGEAVKCFDVLQICGINPKPNRSKQDEIDNKGDEKPSNERSPEVEDCFYTKIRFKRLIVASRSFLAVDENGVVYLICSDDYISQKSSLTNKLLPHSQHLGISMSVGWEVGGLGIGCQKPPSGLTNGHPLNISSKKLKCSSGEVGSSPDLSGFSVAQHTVDPTSKLSNRVRRVFLPIDGCGKDDSISFSPFGIIRLIRRCNIDGKKCFKVVNTPLHVPSKVHDDRDLDSQSTSFAFFEEKRTFTGEVVGCCFQGCFYLVTTDGLSAVFPSISVSSNVVNVESLGYWSPSFSTGCGYQIANILAMKKSELLSPPWKVEVLDRILLYEGSEEADRMCLVNGWDLTIARLRRLQLALDYLKADEIERSLEMLVEVNLAEEGILRLIFTAVHRTFCQVSNGNEVALASRLLALAASFAIKMVRKYGLLLHDKGRLKFLNEELIQRSYSRRLCEMAHFLEVIRNIQCRLNGKCRRPSQVLVDNTDVLNVVDTKSVSDDSHRPNLQIEAVSSSDMQNQYESALPESDLAFDRTKNLALMPVESLEPLRPLGLVNFNELSIVSSHGGIEGRKMISLENPKAMMTRWEIDKLDLKTVVKDALHSGRLPLAVLQLHLQHLKNLVTEEKPQDIFNEVREVGRAIAYDLFLKGETELAVATLQRLGEDIEISLKQLLFGTVRRSLRLQLVEQMQRYGFLAPNEWKTLERISLIERLYPSCSFWRTYRGQQKKLNEVLSSSALPEENKLQLMFSDSFHDCTIECGEVDGVVIGPWASITGSSAFPVVDEDNTHDGYWAAAAIWSDAWDQKTIDRVVLDRPFLMGVHVSWESQLEYHICHNDWEEVSKLLDIIPSSLLLDGSLQISLDGLNSVANVGCHPRYPDYDKYLCSSEELESVCMNVPNIKLLKSSACNMCSIWLRRRMEEILAKRFIFLKEYWEGTSEIIALLSRSGFVINKSKTSVQAESVNNLSDPSFSDSGGESHKGTEQAFHRLLIYHCARYDLPNLLDLYLDHHNLVLDNDSLMSLQDAAGDCEWAKWLLLSRVKGREYDASFSNARSVVLRNLSPDSNVNAPEIDEIIHTVDDMAEGGGEMAALATLMYASVPVQKCLCSGSVNRHINSSVQCTLENLRPALQRFPTLWRTLVAACFGQDINGSLLGPSAKMAVFGNSALSDYLVWRENIFISSGRDTSLLQMLPCWFSKSIRRLVQLFVQGPFGWQSFPEVPGGDSFLHRDIDFFASTGENAEISGISWEAAIEKSVEEELYASSIKEKGFGVEHYLHRGRTLAAFNNLLAARVHKLKSGNTHQKQSGSSGHGPTNVQSDVQLLLAPLSQSEQSLLSSVVPLSIMHFEDSVLVASCAFLLELCGLSANMIRLDIAALRRISSFYNSSEHAEYMKLLSPKSSAFHAVSHEGDIAVSLARALAEDYLHRNSTSVKEQETSDSISISKSPSRALMAVLQHLEKVSLPSFVDGKTCGSWLFDGCGDGTEIRSQQKSASQHWNLVTSFCQMHELPLSTKYLSVLARDNDWVGFLTEAQVGGYPFDMIIQVASKEFSDSRLKIHIVTVLRSMYLTRKKASTSSNSSNARRSNEIELSTENSAMIPVELFGLLAECEKQKNPGEALLLKAKDLRWSLLAMIASCFLDVTSLSCLTVWLEITAARETSSIKVNDIASQIANNVGAAVKSTNSLPAGSRNLAFRYNRKNAKRRRLIEPKNGENLVDIPSNGSGTAFVEISVTQDRAVEAERTKQADEEVKVVSGPDEGLVSLTKMVGVLCEQRLFLPLLRAFEMFLPSCSLLPFIRALQAFSQMRLSEASAHLASFSARIKEEPLHLKTNLSRDGKIGSSWISSTAVGAADAVLSTCPSPYEKRCLLQLLSATDFGDGGSATTCFRRLYWKINLAEPSLRKDDDLYLGNETLDDASLLAALEKSGHWEQARNWAKQLEASGGPWKSIVHHVTETQAEAMVAEWKEYLWDVPEERAALWSHCQTLFLRYSFPALQAGLFFLNHAETVEKDVPARELHEMLLLSLQWLSGMITQSNPVYPLHLLREIETRVWLLAVESEAQRKSEGEFNLSNSGHNLVSGNTSTIIERTAGIITKMDNHLNIMRSKAMEKNDARESSLHTRNLLDANNPTTTGGNIKTKRRAKSYLTSRKPPLDTTEKNSDPADDGSTSPVNIRNNIEIYRSSPLQEENVKLETSLSRWEERVGTEELERAVLSLLEFGQVTAAQQLQQKLSPEVVPSEFLLVDAALKLASISTPNCNEASLMTLDEEALSVILSNGIIIQDHSGSPLQVLESLATKCTKDGGRGLCKRIIAVVKAANVLGIQFSEAFGKRPLELLQLLSLKAQDSFEEAKLLVKTHAMPPASIAQILAESFLKGLLAAHRGGYMESQKEEGPAPLLWRISDFLKWAELCPSEPEIGHSLMRLVITGQEIPHACEVELLILSHHFYKSSVCLDGVDVLVALAATRVESYVSEGDFSCLARLVIGVSNFHALNFILGILIENGQLELLLQKYSAADTATGTAETVRGFRMAVLTLLKHFNPHDVDAFAMVYNHFDMKHEMAALLESRAIQSIQQWHLSYDREQNEDLLESMRYFIKTAEVHSSIDAGNKTRRSCAQASLLSLQIRMPDFNWLNLSMTNARRALVEQCRFQEALIVAEAYNLNQPSEWALVLWNQMLKPELTEQFVAEFVAVLPLQPSMLADIAKFYRAEVAARVDHSNFSMWLSPAEWLKHLARSFRCLLKRTRDLRLRLQLATVATGFGDMAEACMKTLDKVPDTAGPLVLRKGHGGAYLPLM